MAGVMNVRGILIRLTIQAVASYLWVTLYFKYVAGNYSYVYTDESKHDVYIYSWCIAVGVDVHICGFASDC